MIYSKQKAFCNTCGKELFVEIASCNHFDGRFCSKECCREFSWRKTLSICGEEYKLDPELNKK
jgi:hypothetical protein